MFKWKNHRVRTYGDLIRVILLIKTEEEAKKFFEVYEKVVGKIARSNLRSVIGHLDMESRTCLYSLFAFVWVEEVV